MKLVKGWRKMDNDRGFMNTTTEQTLIVKKKEFGQHYLVMLYPKVKGDEEGKKISPEFQTESKAEAFALAWMEKNPKGTL